MTVMITLPGLQIKSELIHSECANFIPPSWPPPDDFPVVINANGDALSRYGEPSWDVSPWAGTASKVNFGDGKTKGARVNRPNADVFRMVVGYWLWGPNAVRNVRTLKSRHEIMKPLFVTCTNAGIVASELYRFPKVIEQVAASITPSRACDVLSCLASLWLAREELGFTILDDAGLKQFSGLIPDRNSTQTAYIPPRIWTYQVLRLKECLDDYITHRQQIEACFRFCLNAYVINAGGNLAESSKRSVQNDRAPFNPQNVGRVRGDCVFHGAFHLTAKRFGIQELIDRWVTPCDRGGIKSLCSYMSLISNVGLAYVLNFSLMRIDEGISLRANCYEVERDSLGEDIHLIGGATTKTIADTDARWIVSPNTKVSVEAMTSVARLRVDAAQHNAKVNLSGEDIRNPLLQQWAYEPWGTSKRNREAKKKRRNYKEIIKSWPKLFDKKQLQITSEDLAIAQRMTFGLDTTRIAVGKVWPLAWHQLRRTGSVNMLASGVVSDASLQYQLKHATRAMSRYYGQNYYHLKVNLDDNARGVYLREMYQTLVREFQGLRSEKFVSPYGDKRKAQIIISITEKDHQGVLRAAEAGHISYRENFLGGCAKLGLPCKLGGISNVSGCMGFGSRKPCEDLLLDREKRPVVVALHDIAVAKKAEAEPGSALSDSLQAQIESTERALNVIDTV